VRCIRRTRSARRTRSHAVSAVRPLVRIAAQPRWRKGGPGWGWCSRSVCAVRPLVRFAPPPRESPALLNPSPPEGEGGARDGSYFCWQKWGPDAGGWGVTGRTMHAARPLVRFAARRWQRRQPARPEILQQRHERLRQRHELPRRRLYLPPHPPRAHPHPQRHRQGKQPPRSVQAAGLPHCVYEAAELAGQGSGEGGVLGHFSVICIR